MHAERVLLPLLLAVPVIVASVGWPAFVNWAAGPAPRPTPEMAGAEATSAATHVSQATPRPTVGTPSTVVAQAPATQIAPTQGPVPTLPRPTSLPTPEPTVTQAGVVDTPPAPAAEQPAQAPTPAIKRPAVLPPPPSVASTRSGDPAQTVMSFYALVGEHQFQTAAQLWSPRMRAAFPPVQNIDQRFGATRAISVNRAVTTAQNPSSGQATVAVDLVETTAGGGARHWVGNWYLVRGAEGWLLDQPQLATGP